MPADFDSSLSHDVVVLPWILGARSTLATSQITVMVVARYVLGVALPVIPLSAVLTIIMLSNFVFPPDAKQLSPARLKRYIRLLFLFDSLSLTLILALAGGPSNPFTLLYLVQITFSAILLTKAETWMLGFVSSLGYASLFFWSEPIPGLGMHMMAGKTERLHLIGMWVGFVFCTALITLFAGRISEILRDREMKLREAERKLALRERLAALTTLAAGAAHEIANPLATIAVIASELEQECENDLQRDDLTQIVREVERCKRILKEMSANGGDLRGEPCRKILPEQFVAAIQSRFPRVSFIVQNPANKELLLPSDALHQSVCNLVQNALDARLQAEPVVKLEVAGDRFKVIVQDDGHPIPATVLRQIGDPFFTTKQSSSRIGLGAFLVQTLADELGGSIHYETGDHGTTASLELPIHALDGAS